MNTRAKWAVVGGLVTVTLLLVLGAGTVNDNGIYQGIQLGGTTNVLSDNGTNLTRNGTAISAANWVASGTTNSTLAGTAYVNGLQLTNTLNFGGDTILQRDAANTLALRNGANAQAFNIYSTYTDVSNYERLGITSGSQYYILSSKAGTGSVRELIIGTDGAAPLSFWANGSRKWQVTSSGHLIALTDNTYDIGASGANRPRNVYVGTSVSVGGSSLADGTLRLGNSLGDVILSGSVLYIHDTSRLGFGGATASFPSIKRSGTSLESRLADDSASGSFIAGAYDAPSTLATLTPADAGVTLDFSATTRTASMVSTGNVTFVFANQAVGKTYLLYVQGCSTNSAITWPTDSGIYPAGVYPTVLPAYKWTKLRLQCITASSVTNVWIEGANSN